MDKNMNIHQLEAEIKKKNDELSALYSQRRTARNHTLNEVMERIFEKIDRDKLYKNEDLEKRYIHTVGDAGDYPYAGVFLKSYKDDYGECEETDLGDDETEILSVTFNIKYDSEVQKIMDEYYWEELEG